MAEEAPDDHDAYWQERFDAAVKAGLTNPQARRFANGPTTLHELQRCVDGGATPELIARVVC